MSTNQPPRLIEGSLRQVEPGAHHANRYESFGAATSKASGAAWHRAAGRCMRRSSTEARRDRSKGARKDVARKKINCVFYFRAAATLDENMPAARTSRRCARTLVNLCEGIGQFGRLGLQKYIPLVNRSFDSRRLNVSENWQNRIVSRSAAPVFLYPSMQRVSILGKDATLRRLGHADQTAGGASVTARRKSRFVRVMLRKIVT
jgi:hypothetical protein